MGLLDGLAKKLIKNQGTRKATEQVLGSRWGWLVGLRDGIESYSPISIMAAINSSDLSVSQIRMLAEGAKDAITMRESKK